METLTLSPVVLELLAAAGILFLAGIFLYLPRKRLVEKTVGETQESIQQKSLPDFVKSQLKGGSLTFQEILQATKMGSTALFDFRSMGANELAVYLEIALEELIRTKQVRKGSFVTMGVGNSHRHGKKETAVYSLV